MILLGLIGKKRAGKDCLANYVKNKYKNKDIEILAFAKPIKDMCKNLFCLTENQLYGDEKEDIDERYNLSTRTIMQRLGTELFRDNFSKIFPELNWGKDIWVKVMENKLNEYVNTNKIVIISDVRFLNETKLIKKYNGKLIKIIRKELKMNDTHISENEINNFKPDIIINNDSNVKEYYKKIDKLKIIS